jgi:predicted nucleic acid-binding Zn ribbon protein
MTDALPIKDEELERFYNRALEAFPESPYPRELGRVLAREFPNRKVSRAVFFGKNHFTHKKAKQLYALAFATRQTLEALVRARHQVATGEEYTAFASSPYGRKFVVLPTGRVCEREDLFNDGFLAGALAAVNITRMMHCEICGSLAYAVREGQKCCSRTCNLVRRVRLWRAKQSKHEHNRKLKSAGVKPAREKES